jgi:RHS repeat-associated protein
LKVEITAREQAGVEAGWTATQESTIAFDADWQTAYQYDGRNNLTQKIEGLITGGHTITTYEYDLLDRLTKVTLPDGSAREYHYDVSTRRAASTFVDLDYVTKTHELHAYGPGWETLADLDGVTKKPTRVYVTAGGMDAQVAMLVLRNGAWRTYYYLRDHQGSVVGLVDGATGVMVEAYEYEPYGLPTVWQTADPNAPAVPPVVGSPAVTSYPRRMDRSALGNRFLYTGREWEADAGFYHFRFRVYSPEEKRFLQSDPIGLAGGWNHYAYCGGNPVMKSDPTGLDPLAAWMLWRQLDPEVADAFAYGAIVDGLWGNVLPFQDAAQAGTALGSGDGWGALYYFSSANLKAFGLVGLAQGILGLRTAVTGAVGAPPPCPPKPTLSAAASAVEEVATAVDEVATVATPPLDDVLANWKGVEGIYEFTAASGKKYIGQSIDIARRLKQHIVSGKFKPQDIMSFRGKEVSGGKYARRVAEQSSIDANGGMRSGLLENQINSIAR